MIKTKNVKLYTAFPIFKKLAEKELPIKTSFGIAKLISEVTNVMQTIELERCKIGEKYGKLNENGTEYVIAPENVESFNKDLAELSDIEITINADKIPLSDEIAISAADLLLIEDFVEIEG